jgi:hypothetical protein
MKSACLLNTYDMSNKSVSAAGQISWSLQGPTTGYTKATQADSLSLMLGSLNLTTWNQTYFADITIAASGSYIIDLTSLTDPFGTTYAATSLKAMLITCSGASIKFGPQSGSNPQQWFFNATSDYITIQDGGGFLFIDPAAYGGPTVDGTHKTFTITNNSGAVSVVVSIAIIVKS